ncbi:TRAP transporter small permease subunit [Oceanibium sediminis]|uniref:TRAP transporter small permease subunit n=1 Tax=Oceanibium sediminis TaxID=2026339 RepID=UPI000DD45D6F|nr:TRAP transporter small permease [Oceanibium sediminis]
MDSRLLNGLRRINHGLAILIGIVLLGCATIVLLDIVLRQLGSSFGGTDEISGYVMAIVTSWGMAYTLLELGHVRIDFLRATGGPKFRAVLDLLAMVILAATVSLIAIQSWPVLERSLTNSSTANTPLETPLALVQTPWFLGWVWFAIVSWLTFVSALAMVMRGDYGRSEAAIGVFGEEEEVLK